MAKHYTVRNIRIPAELDDAIVQVVKDGERYKSLSQFFITAIRRLVTFEEGEVEKKRVAETLSEFKR